MKTRDKIEQILKMCFLQSTEESFDKAIIRAINEIEHHIGNNDFIFSQMQSQIEDLQGTKEECLNLLEDTKNAYAWWIDEKGLKELDKRDYEHYDNLLELLNKYGRTDH
jgi:hypothetical protein